MRSARPGVGRPTPAHPGHPIRRSRARGCGPVARAPPRPRDSRLGTGRPTLLRGVVVGACVGVGGRAGRLVTGAAGATPARAAAPPRRTGARRTDPAVPDPNRACTSAIVRSSSSVISPASTVPRSAIESTPSALTTPSKSCAGIAVHVHAGGERLRPQRSPPAPAR